MENTQPVPVSDAARRFAEEYLIDFKLSSAADRSGISATHASNLLADPRVQALISEGKRRASLRVDVSVDNVLHNLRIVADVVSIADFFETVCDPVTLRTYDRLKHMDQWSAEMRKAVKSIKWTKNGPELTLHDSLAANVHIGKFFGMFIDKSEISGPGGKPIPIIDGTMTPQQAAEAYAMTLAGK